uniref:Helicase ARIP4 n=1 Tax=Strongyloides venezuelensis TaxID=75913 RepID=A0A0K0FSJ2_STRVS
MYLICANRLVIFDPDWNPANDKQAIAKIWRDEQTKTCFIYRFLAPELKSQHELKTGTNSDTHDKLECRKCVNGREVENSPDDATTKSDLSLWHHITKENISKIPDDVFKNVLSIPEIPITFYQKYHGKKVK